MHARPARARRGHHVLAEPGRQIVREELAIGSDGVPWENESRSMQLVISRAMHQYNRAPRTGTVFADRSILDCVSAYEAFPGHIPDHARRALLLYRYDEGVFVVPPRDELFASDAERQHGFADAVGEDERLVPFFGRHGYRVIEVPRASVETRAAFVVERTQSDLSSAQASNELQ